jgi:hypothetical protein
MRFLVMFHIMIREEDVMFQLSFVSAVYWYIHLQHVNVVEELQVS